MSWATRAALLTAVATLWSRGGSFAAGNDETIAFLRDGDVWTTHADGAEQARLTTFGDVGALAWSSRGGGLAFGRPNEVWVMDETGRGQRLVARTEYTGELYKETYRLVAARPHAPQSIRLVPSFAWLSDRDSPERQTSPNSHETLSSSVAEVHPGLSRFTHLAVPPGTPHPSRQAEPSVGARRAAPLAAQC